MVRRVCTAQFTVDGGEQLAVRWGQQEFWLLQCLVHSVQCSWCPGHCAGWETIPLNEGVKEV